MDVFVANLTIFLKKDQVYFLHKDQYDLEMDLPCQSSMLCNLKSQEFLRRYFNVSYVSAFMIQHSIANHRPYSDIELHPPN